jgi:hypothetical protein
MKRNKDVIMRRKRSVNMKKRKNSRQKLRLLRLNV